MAEMNQKPKKRGISLLEMLVSLGIFTVIVLPLVSLPIKAKEQNNDALNNGKIDALVSDILNNTLAKDINSAASFMPLSTTLCLYNPDNSPCTANYTNYLFLASPSTNRADDSRIAYRIIPKKKIQDFGDIDQGDVHSNGDNTESHPPQAAIENVYVLQRLKIGPTDTLSSIIDNKNWVTLGDENSSKQLTFNALRFSYCKDGHCTTTNNPLNDNGPKDADAVQLTSINTSARSSDPSFTIKVGNTTLKQSPIYYKLGSQQTNIDADNKIYAFPTVLNSYGSLSSAVPINNDIAFDYKTGEIIIAGLYTNSTGNQVIYINKCRSEVGCSSTSFDNLNDSYYKYLPVNMLTSRIPAWDVNYTIKSVTQDNTGNLFVLATSTTPGINPVVLRFTAQGVFDGSFNVSSDSIALTFDISIDSSYFIRKLSHRNI